LPILLFAHCHDWSWLRGLCDRTGIGGMLGGLFGKKE
jgi:hypothetical protein